MNRCMIFEVCAAGFLAGSAAVAAELVQTNPPAAPGPAPRIQFDSTTYNFGKLKSGDTAKHDFIFTNTGTVALEITEVKPGCGCTTAGAWDKNVEPGKTGIIPLQFNSTGFGGQVGKSAFVTCNDPSRSNVILQISGTVWKPIDIMPQMAMFTPFSEAPTNETKVLKITSNLEEPITLTNLQCTSPSFKVELKETKPGKEFDLQVTAVPPFTNPTVFGTITLKTSSTNVPMLSVSAYAMVQQPIAVTPQQVTLPAGPLKNPVTSAILVRNNTTNPVAISDVRLEIPGVNLKVTEPQTGQLYAITMTFPAGFELQQTQKVELSMKSTHPKFAEIKVPVIQMKPIVAAAPAPQGSTGPAHASAVGPGLLRPASPIVRPSVPIPAPPLDPGKVRPPNAPSG